MPILADIHIHIRKQPYKSGVEREVKTESKLIDSEIPWRAGLLPGDLLAVVGWALPERSSMGWNWNEWRSSSQKHPEAPQMQTAASAEVLPVHWFQFNLLEQWSRITTEGKCSPKQVLFKARFSLLWNSPRPLADVPFRTGSVPETGGCHKTNPNGPSDRSHCVVIDLLCKSLFESPCPLLVYVNKDYTHQTSLGLWHPKGDNPCHAGPGTSRLCWKWSMHSNINWKELRTIQKKKKKRTSVICEIKDDANFSVLFKKSSISPFPE